MPDEQVSCGGRATSWLATHRPRVSDFKMVEKDITRFTRSQWPMSQTAFLIYRIIIALYTLSWLLMSIVNAGLTTGLGGFFVFLTNWSFIVLALYLIIACLSTMHATYRGRCRSQPSEVTYNQTVPSTADLGANSTSVSTDPLSTHGSAEQLDVPVYSKITWFLLYTSLAFSPIISVVYWLVIFNPAFVYANQGGAYGVALTVHRHALNTVITYVDLAMSATPVRFWHFIYPCFYGLGYIIFSLIYYWAGGFNPYKDGIPAIYPKYLDWRTPGTTVLFVLALLVVVIVFHALAVGFYKLRVRVAGKVDEVTVLNRMQAQPTTEGTNALTDEILNV